jgi:hypothetical protein
MGNVAIAFINSSMALNEFLLSKYNARIEHKRLASLIPRYISRLNRSDSTITVLNLNNLRVDCAILKKLASPLQSNGNLNVEELYLENNRIGSEGATCVARILAADAALKIVSLANNPIGSMGAMALASAIESNRTLEKLNLSHCNIDDAGVQKLAASLKRNSFLKYLNLEGNPISSKGMHTLFQSIYDTTDGITSLWGCNHTIRSFTNGMTSLYSPSFPDTQANRLLSRKITDILAWCNCRPDSKKIAASRKILRYFFDDRDEYMTTLENTEEKLVPHLMRWLGQHGDAGVVYNVVRIMPQFLELRKLDTSKVLLEDGNGLGDRKRKHVGSSKDDLDIEEEVEVEERDEKLARMNSRQ